METASPFPEVFIGRQPILDRQQVTFGYELLFRTGRENAADVIDGHLATADVVCKAFAELGLAAALGDQRAFINVDAAFLDEDAVLLLPKKQVVLDLELSGPVPAATIERCRELRTLGYEFAVAGLTPGIEGHPALIELASFVRIDVDELAPEALAAVTAALQAPFRRLIAGRVESDDAHRICLEAGFDYFQGYYFARPIVVEGRKLDASMQGLLRIINLLNGDAEVGQLERAFKAEPALTVNLLRLTNSVGAGLAVKVGSIRHAITVLGRKQLQRWLQLLVFSRSESGGGIAGNPLMEWAALRGRFLELLALRCYPARKDMPEKAFITGLISLMPTALGMPIETILEQIGLPPDVRGALARREGEVGALLEVAERYDGDDFDGTLALFSRIGTRLNLETLAQCLIDALAWVRQLAVETE